MKPTLDQISELLSQRKGIHPEAGYWQDFLVEFHHNQRVSSVAKSAPYAFFDGIHTWFSEVSPSKWAYGAGLAYATASVAFLLAPRSVEINMPPPTPVNHQVLPAPQMQQLERPDPKPPSPANPGEHSF